MAVVESVFVVPEIRFEHFEERVTELSRRAAKLGAQPLVMEVIARELRRFDYVRRVFVEGAWQDVETSAMKPAAVVRVSGETPRIEGWTYLGCANLKNNKGQDRMTASTAPGISADEVRTWVGLRADARGAVLCAHCNTRRNRKLAFVLRRDADGHTDVFGSDCVQDFLGVDPNAMLRSYERYNTAFGELREAEQQSYQIEWDFAGYLEALRTTSMVDLHDLVHAMTQVLEEDGGLLKAADLKERGLPTVHERATALAFSGQVKRARQDFVDEFLRWIPAMGYRRDDLWRLKRPVGWALDGDGKFDIEEAELLLQGVIAFAQENGWRFAGEWIGEPGTPPVDLELRIAWIRHEQTERDVWTRGQNQVAVTKDTLVMSLRDADNNRFIWRHTFSQNEIDHGWEPGQWWRVRAKVKDHTVDNMLWARTVLERAKLVAPIPPPTPGA